MSEAHPPTGPAWAEVNDKLVHLGLYSVLGATLAWAGARGRGRSAVTLLLAGAGYGALDEWHQALVPGRDPSLGDWIADAVGVVLGFLLLRFYLGRPDFHRKNT